jgi:hypothetical protein
MSTTPDKENRKIEDLKLILKDLLKVIKIVSMYPENNPLPQSLRRTFAEKLVDLTADFGQLDFQIEKERIRFEAETVFIDRTREESLAELFFGTGIVKLSFKPYLEVEDVYALLDTIKKYQNTDRLSGDLAGLLWEAAIPHFGFETIEDTNLRQYDNNALASDFGESGEQYRQIAGDEMEAYDAIFDRSADGEVEGVMGDGSSFENATLANDSGEVDTAALSSILSTGNDEEDAVLKVTEAVEAMGFEDVPASAPDLPDTNLILNSEYKLSEEETEQVATLRRRDAEFDEFESIGEILKEILHQEPEMNPFYESVTICEKVLTELVQAGKLTFATDLLRYFKTLEDQLASEKPMWSERLKEGRRTAGSRERLAILCDSLNENEEIGSHELRGYLDNFDWEALMGVTDMMGELSHEMHRNAVKDYLTSRGRDRVAIVAKGISDRRPDVVAASVMILGGIGNDQALQQLARVADHEDSQVKTALVTALTNCPNDACLSILRQLVRDKEASVRRDAVAAIVKRRGATAFDILTDIVNDDQFHKLDHDEQRSILVAYSVLGGDQAVDYLVRLGEQVNLFRNRGLSFYREASFEALAHNRGERAERTLVKLAGSWRADIKAHAKAALQKRRELIYGGDDE